MTAEEFVNDLDARNQTILKRLDPESTLKPEVAGDLTVLNLLKVALKNEIEATEIASRWLVTTDDVEVKMAFARQAGDEAKHYRMIAERLRELGFDARGFNPIAKGYGPLFQYLDTLTTTVERVAAGQFTREAIAVVKNRQFIEFCEQAGTRSRRRSTATSSSPTSTSTTSWAARSCSASPRRPRRRSWRAGLLRARCRWPKSSSRRRSRPPASTTLRAADDRRSAPS